MVLVWLTGIVLGAVIGYSYALHIFLTDRPTGSFNAHRPGSGVCEMIQNSMDWTHEQMLGEVGELCQSSEKRPDRLMVIALWNEDHKYDTRFWNVGLSVSEMIALLEVQKARLLELMKDTKR